MNIKSIWIALAISASALPVSAACYGSDSFYSCSDGGNRYTVNRFGDTTTMRGSNAETGSTWSQRSSTFGNTTTHRGTSSDGGNWNMRESTFGGRTTYSGTDSDGNTFRQTCGSLGCY